MVIGALTVDLIISESNSLKDKRQVIKSLLDGIRNKFNVSAAELDCLYAQRRSIIGIATISNNQKVANAMLNRIMERIESNPRVEVADSQLEFIQ